MRNRTIIVAVGIILLSGSHSRSEICRADLDGDGSVYLPDLIIFKSETTACSAHSCRSDLNGNTAFDLADVVIMRSEYGRNDCEGICIPGTIMLCHTGLPGACNDGVKTCFDNYWGNCISTANQTDEVCDTIDNDCDGLTDEEGICLSATAFPQEEWVEIAPEHLNVNPEKLHAAMDYLGSQAGPDQVKNAVVIRNGYLIWKGPDSNALSDVWSVAKSFISTVSGLLIDEGKADLNTLSKDYIPVMEEYYPEVTLRHFATFTSGYNASMETGNNAFYVPLPPLHVPGEDFYYSEACIDQFAHTLTRIADEPLAAYFKRKIADEIKMDESRWFWNIEAEIDGYAINGGKGLHVSSQQLARIGHLFLNKGRWNGKQLISEEWISEATKLQVPASTPCTAGVNLSGRYGYNWWVNGIGQDGFKTWPHAPDTTYCMMGHKYNALFVIPEWNMVIARVGDNGVFEMYYGPPSPWDVFLQKMGEALIE